MTNVYGMFRWGKNITNLILPAALNTSNLLSMNRMFDSLKSLQSINTLDFDTENVTDMRYLFNGMESLTSLDISNFDTSKVSNMSFMFNRVRNVDSLNLTSLSTANVTNMDSMFGNADSLTSLDLTGFDTSNVTDMNEMFFQMDNLEQVDLSSFNTSNVSTFYRMFRYYDEANGHPSALTTLDVSSFDFSNATSMTEMFNHIFGLTTLTLPSNINTSKNLSLRATFSNNHSLTALDVSGFDTENVTDMGYLFSNTRSLTSIDVSGFNTGNVLDMRNMFITTWNLSSLDLSLFDTSNVTNMEYMFAKSRSLPELSLASFDTSNVTNMQSMFEYDDGGLDPTSLTSLNLSSFDFSNVSNLNAFLHEARQLSDLTMPASINTSNVTDFGLAFQQVTSLEFIDLSQFDTSNALALDQMFLGSNSLVFDASHFITSNATTMGSMFKDVDAINNLDLSGYDTSNVLNVDSIFAESDNLSYVNLTGWNISNVTDSTDAFLNTPALGTTPNKNVACDQGGSEGTGTIFGENCISVPTQPTVSIGVPSTGSINSSQTVTFTLTYDVVPSSLDAGDIMVSGNAEGCGVVIVDASTLTPDVEVSGCTGNGTITISLAAGTSNTLGRVDAGAGPSASVTVSNTAVPFVSVWNVANPGDTLTIPTNGSVGFDYTIDWGDGTVENLTTGSPSHLYTNAGDYEITISGTFPNIFISAGSYRLNLLEVKSLGSVGWQDFRNAFDHAENLHAFSAGSGVDTSSVTSMYGMFARTSGLTSLNFQGFDTSNVETMQRMFEFSSQNVSPQSVLDLSEFNTANVTNMRSMFLSSNILEINVNSFDTSNVINFDNMFEATLLTALDLSHFNTSKASNMNRLFRDSALTSLAVVGWDLTLNPSATGIFTGTTPLGTSPNKNIICDDPDGGTGIIGTGTFFGENCQSPSQPSVSIGAPSVSALNSAGTVSFELTYEVAPDSLDSTDITVNGDSGGCTVQVIDATTTTPDVEVSGCTGDGSITVSLAAGTSNRYTILDGGAGPSSSVTVDNTAPTVSIGAPSLTEISSSDKVTFTLTYEVAPAALINTDVTVNGDSADCSVNIVDPATTTPDVEITGCTANGSITISVASGKSSDLGGNSDLGAVPSSSVTVSNINQSAFVSVWRTTAANETVTIGTHPGVYNYSIDWGDGTSENLTTEDPSHIYASPGDYTVTIEGTFPSLYLLSNTQIVEVVNLGDVGWQSFEMGFRNSSIESFTFGTGSSVAAVTTFWAMFNDCSSLTSVDLAGIDSYSVADMRNMFNGIGNLDELDLSDLDTSNVDTMYRMFTSSLFTSINALGWDVSNVTDSAQIFQNTTALGSSPNKNIICDQGGSPGTGTLFGENCKAPAAPIVTIGEPSRTIMNSSQTTVYTLTYEVAPTTLDNTDITVNGDAANCVVNVVDATTLTPDVEVTGCTSDGSISIRLSAGTSSNSGTPDAGAGPSTTVAVNNSGVVSTWVHEAYLKSTDTTRADVKFGDNISLIGSKLLVGAPYQDEGSSPSQNQLGRAYLFSRSGSTWSYDTIFQNTVGNEFDRLGDGVALSLNLLAIGKVSDDSNENVITNSAYQSSDASMLNAGSVLIYKENAGSWDQIAYIKPPNPGVDDHFGQILSLSGNMLAVGVDQEDSSHQGIISGSVISSDEDASNSGAVYMFEFDGTNWSQQAWIKSNNSEMGDLFGDRLDLDGDTLVVVASGEDSASTLITNGSSVPSDNDADGSGAAFVYRLYGSEWRQEAYIKPGNNHLNSTVRDVHLSGNLLAVGVGDASSQSTITNGTTSSLDVSSLESGAVFLYRRDGVNWEQEAYIKPSNSNADDRFEEVAVVGSTLVVGAEREASSDSVITNGSGASTDNTYTNYPGAAYVFRRELGNWIQEAYLKPPNNDAAYGARFGWRVDISGDTIAVGVPDEDSINIGTIVNGSSVAVETSGTNIGAIYVFRNQTRMFDPHLLIGAVSATSIELVWDADSLGSTNQVKVAPETAGLGVSTEFCTAPSSVTKTAGSTSHTFTSLTPGQRYGFRICAFDGTNTTEGTTIWLQTANEAPTISDVGDQAIDEDTSTTSLAVSIADTETALDCMADLSGSSDNTTLVNPSSFSFTGTAPNCSVVVTPLANQNGTTVVTLTVDDGFKSSTDTFTLTVNSLNDTPEVTSSGSDFASTAVDTLVNVSLSQASDPDVATNGETLTYSVSTSPSNGVLGSFPASAVTGGTVSYTPAVSYLGPDSFGYQICDSNASQECTSEITVDILVSDPANAATTDISLSATAIDEGAAGGSTVATVSATDATPAETFAFSLVGGAGSEDNSDFTVVGSDLRPVSDLDYEVKNSFNIRIRSIDSGYNVLEKAFIITVNDLNDTPVISAITDQTAGIDENISGLSFTVSDQDDALVCSAAVTPTSSNQGLVSDAELTVTGTAPNCELAINLDSGGTGVATITLTVSDGTDSSQSGFDLTVANLPTAPTLPAPSVPLGLKATLTGTCDSTSGYTTTAQVQGGGSVHSVDCAGGVLTVEIADIPEGLGNITVRARTEQDSDTSLFRKVTETYLHHFVCPRGYIGVPGKFPSESDVAGLGNASASAGNANAWLDPTKDFCVMKYETKGVTSTHNSMQAWEPVYHVDFSEPPGTLSAIDPLSFLPDSRPFGVPINYVTRDTSISMCKLSNEIFGLCSGLGCYSSFDNSAFGFRLLSNTQWQVIARNIEKTDLNWSGGAAGSGFLMRGNSDGVIGVDAGANSIRPNLVGANNLAAPPDDINVYFGTGNDASENSNATSGSQEKRVHYLSNGNVIWDLAGNLWEWVSDDRSSLGIDAADDATLSGNAAFASYTNGASARYSATTNLIFAGSGTVPYDETVNAGMAFGDNGNAVARGGDFDDASGAGIFAVTVQKPSTEQNAKFGYRCAFIPEPVSAGDTNPPSSVTVSRVDSFGAAVSNDAVTIAGGGQWHLKIDVTDNENLGVDASKVRVEVRRKIASLASDFPVSSDPVYHAAHNHPGHFNVPDPYSDRKERGYISMTDGSLYLAEETSWQFNESSGSYDINDGSFVNYLITAIDPSGNSTDLTYSVEVTNSCPPGFVGVPGKSSGDITGLGNTSAGSGTAAKWLDPTLDFCVMKTHAKAKSARTSAAQSYVGAKNFVTYHGHLGFSQTGSGYAYTDAASYDTSIRFVPYSFAGATMWTNITHPDAVSACRSLHMEMLGELPSASPNSGFNLMSNTQWQVMARNAQFVAKNWSDGFSLGAEAGVLARGLTETHNGNSALFGFSLTPGETSIASSHFDSWGYFGQADLASGQPDFWTLGASLSSNAEAELRIRHLSNGVILWDVGGGSSNLILDNIVELGIPTGNGTLHKTNQNWGHNDPSLTASENLIWSNEGTPYSSPYAGILGGGGGSGEVATRGGNVAVPINTVGVFAADLSRTFTETNTGMGYRCSYVP